MLAIEYTFFYSKTTCVTCVLSVVLELVLVLMLVVNDGDYIKAVMDRNDAESISRVLYPNDNVCYVTLRYVTCFCINYFYITVLYPYTPTLIQYIPYILLLQQSNLD